MNAIRVLRATTVALVAATVLAVSGCATADTAAVVDGRRITEAQVQEAVTQIKKINPEAQIDTVFALRALVFAPFVTDVADRAGKGISDSYAAQLLGGSAQDFNPYTLDLVKASWLLDSQSNPNALTSTEQAQFADAVAKATITVNPRYGTFDRKSLNFEESSPNWIKAGSEPSPTPTQG